MGCAASRGGVSNSELLRELELLKSNQMQLRQENQELRRGCRDADRDRKLVVTQSPRKLVGQEQPTNRNLPKVGDPVLAMWSCSMWQYFTATIVAFDARELRYTIEWDDHDPSGRVVDYYNLALDQVPDHDEVAVGSVVLFPQGKYSGEEGVRLGGMRYHQGRITKVYKNVWGKTFYGGEHTKGEAEGKWTAYLGYKQHFRGLECKHFRISPNVLDILSAQREETTEVQMEGMDECDVYISYSRTNSHSAMSCDLLPHELPPSYDEAVLSNMCDPRDIRLQLSNAGVQVNTDTAGGNLMSNVNMINTAKVFIACLSDEYARDEICRQEFQYAKKTINKPVIPVVVGSGSSDWQKTVVGMLTVGEVLIRFDNKDVQEAKMAELVSAIQSNLHKIGAGPLHPTPPLSPPDSLAPDKAVSGGASPPDPQGSPPPSPLAPLCQH